MNNFTTNTYELKREICNFSEKIANGTSKPAKKFVVETQYGLAKGGSCLVSNIARALDEDIKLNYTIDRLYKWSKKAYKYEGANSNIWW